MDPATSSVQQDPGIRQMVRDPAAMQAGSVWIAKTLQQTGTVCTDRYRVVPVSKPWQRSGDVFLIIDPFHLDVIDTPIRYLSAIMLDEVSVAIPERDLGCIDAPASIIGSNALVIHRVSLLKSPTV